MVMEDIQEYIEAMYRTAERLWGREDTKKMRSHIEDTARAVYRIGQLELDNTTEPATMLRHRDQQ